jgi:DivIVA domain-containing protein
MPLTAADVRATTFGTTRLRSGYSMDEVDAFLDIVEADVAQYSDELQRSRDGEAVLRTQCEQLQTRLSLAEERLAEAQAAVAALQARAAQQALPEPPVVPDDVAEAIAADDDASAVLAIAQRTADEMVRYAQQRSDAVRAAVRAMLTEQLAVIDRS